MTAIDRRGGMKAALAAGVGLAAIGAARADAPAAKRVVYHLADAEKVVFVLGNLRNHLAGAGGPEAIQLAVVVHGRALHVLRGQSPDVALKSDVRQLISEGVVFHACANTMAAMKLKLDDLLPGFRVAEKGGVVLLADLQAQGWVYLRP